MHKKNKCIKSYYNNVYNVVMINIDENSKSKNSIYTKQIKEELQRIDDFKNQGIINKDIYIECIYKLSCYITQLIQTSNVEDEIYDLSMMINKKVIDEPQNKFTGGAYVNYAFTRMHKNMKSMTSKDGFIHSKISQTDEIVETYLVKALLIKSTNNMALYNIAIYYFYIEEYDKSINYFKRLNEEKLFMEYINMVLSPITNYAKLKRNNYMDKEKLRSLLNFYNKLYEIIDYSNALKILIGLIYSDCAGYLGEDLIKYTVMTDILKNCSDNLSESDYKEVYSKLGEVYLKKKINEPEKSIEYYNKIEKYDMSSHMERMLFDNNCSNMALCYFKLKEYDKVIKTINKKRKYNINLNNTDYHTLAATYLKLEDYKNAKDNINMALYMYEDETSLRLASEIYRKSGKTKEAIKFAEKALYFLEYNEHNLIIEKNKMLINSDIIGSVDEFYISLYENLNKCYLSARDYENAYAINEIALEKYPDEDKFKDNLDIAKQFIDVSMKNQIIEKNLKRLEKESRDFKNQIHTTRQWIMGLIQSQNLLTSKNINEESWKVFEKEIEKVVEEMKFEATKSNIEYEDICEKLKVKFSFLSREAFSFLSTAEYLYEYNKNNFIDFAPIVVEFSKVFEVELNRLLKFKKNMTLGQILHDRSLRDSMELSHILDNIEEFIEIRNCSAHTGECTIEKLELMRNKIYNSNILQNIAELIETV